MKTAAADDDDSNVHVNLYQAVDAIAAAAILRGSAVRAADRSVAVLFPALHLPFAFYLNIYLFYAKHSTTKSPPRGAAPASQRCPAAPSTQKHSLKCMY